MLVCSHAPWKGSVDVDAAKEHSVCDSSLVKLNS